MIEHTFDCFRGLDGLLILVSGAAGPPVVTNEDSGEVRVLTPAELRSGIGSWSLVDASADSATPGLYWTPAATPLPAAPDGDVHLRVEVDGVTYRPIVRKAKR